MNRFVTCAFLALALISTPIRAEENWRELPEWIVRIYPTYNPPKVETVLRENGWEIVVFRGFPGNETNFDARIQKGEFTATVSWRPVRHLGDHVEYGVVVYTDRTVGPEKLDAFVTPALQVIGKHVDGKEARRVERMFKGPLHEFVRDVFSYEIWKK